MGTFQNITTGPSPQLILSPNSFNNDTVVKIAVGTVHMLMLTATGKVYGMGSNLYYPLGINYAGIFYSPVLVYPNSSNSDEVSDISTKYSSSAIITSISCNCLITHE